MKDIRDSECGKTFGVGAVAVFSGVIGLPFIVNGVVLSSIVPNCYEMVYESLFIPAVACFFSGFALFPTIKFAYKCYKAQKSFKVLKREYKSVEDLIEGENSPDNMV